MGGEIVRAIGLAECLKTDISSGGGKDTVCTRKVQQGHRICTGINSAVLNDCIHQGNKYIYTPHDAVYTRVISIYIHHMMQGMNEVIGPLYYVFFQHPDVRWKGETDNKGNVSVHKG